MKVVNCLLCTSTAVVCTICLLKTSWQFHIYTHKYYKYDICGYFVIIILFIKGKEKRILTPKMILLSTFFFLDVILLV